jgi:hypothetical protein
MGRVKVFGKGRKKNVQQLNAAYIKQKGLYYRQEYITRVLLGEGYMLIPLGEKCKITRKSIDAGVKQIYEKGGPAFHHFDISNDPDTDETHVTSSVQDSDVGLKDTLEAKGRFLLNLKKNDELFKARPPKKPSKPAAEVGKRTSARLTKEPASTPGDSTKVPTPKKYRKPTDHLSFWKKFQKESEALMHFICPDLEPCRSIDHSAIVSTNETERQNLHIDQQITETYSYFLRRQNERVKNEGANTTVNVPCSWLASPGHASNMYVCPDSWRMIPYLYEKNLLGEEFDKEFIDKYKLEALQVKIPQGYACVFRYDLVHAGAEGKNKNIRFHSYYNHPEAPHDIGETGCLHFVHPQASDFFYFKDE